MQRYDIAVVGLGGMGSSAAYSLARRGLRVIGIERFTAGHSLGSSHGGARIVRSAYFEASGYEPLLARTNELWSKLSCDAGQEVVHRYGGLVIGRPDSETIQGCIRSAQAMRVDFALLDSQEIRARFPNMVPAHECVAFYDPGAGYVNPERTVRLYLRMAAAAGAHLIFNTSVTGWAELPSGQIRLTAGQSEILADKVVMAPGVWAAELLGSAGIQVAAERQLQFWFDPGGAREQWAPQAQPIWIWEDCAAASWGFGFPDIAGYGVKVGFEDMGTPTDPNNLDRSVSESELIAVKRRLANVIPSLAQSECVASDACMYENTPDKDFVIGMHPHNANMIIACGFSGHGFKFVPVVGEILADLAVDESTDLPIGQFDPGRAALNASGGAR